LKFSLILDIKKMPIENRRWNWIWSLTIGIGIIVTPKLAFSQEQKIGWQPWQERSRMNESFPYEAIDESHSTMGPYLEYENFCKTQGATSYWYRLSDSLVKIGIGTIESGCKLNDKFVSTFSANTYVNKTDTSRICLKIITNRGSSLAIRERPFISSKIVGSLQNRSKLYLDRYGSKWFSIDRGDVIFGDKKDRGYSTDRQWLSWGKGSAILFDPVSNHLNFSRCKAKDR
jgi:hypothetical protein